MKTPVSPETRQLILDLRRRHSLSEVAAQTGIPLGTVKTLVSRSGAFRDNPKHRELFSLPPIQESESTAIAVPEMPPQQAVTGDKEVDAILWLQQVVSTGQPELIAKAMEARKRIKTPMATLEKRYLDILIAQNPGNAFGVAFATFGFGDLEGKAEHAVSRNLSAREALSRFGSESGVFTNTPAEQFCIDALAGLKPNDSGYMDLTDVVISRFQSRPEYAPNTLSDCLHELAYWQDLYRLRNAVNRDAGDQWQEVSVRESFVFTRMAGIRPRSTLEALSVMRYMLDDDNSAKDRTGADDIFMNLVT